MLYLRCLTAAMVSYILKNNNKNFRIGKILKCRRGNRVEFVDTISFCEDFSRWVVLHNKTKMIKFNREFIILEKAMDKDFIFDNVARENDIFKMKWRMMEEECMET